MNLTQIITLLVVAIVVGALGYLAYTKWETIRVYWRETRAELMKVSWPTRAETKRLTILVVSTVVASALVLGFFDALFAGLFRQFFSVG